MAEPMRNQERELQELREQLAASQRALQDVVYRVSHDLGAPLRAVTSFSSILQEKYGSNLDDKGVTYLNFITDGGAKAQMMLAGLLQYSRLHTQARPPIFIDLGTVLDRVSDALEDKIAQTQAVINSDALPTVLADYDQMSQLFLALLDNALTYRAEGQAPQIRIKCKDLGNVWRISFEDQGIGLPEECCERVFQLFKRLHADDTYPGIGMGLAIARRIVERHNGSIGIEPMEPQGARCWFTLPKVTQDAVANPNGAGPG